MRIGVVEEFLYTGWCGIWDKTLWCWHFVMSQCAVVAVKMYSGRLDLFLEVYCLFHTDYYDFFCESPYIELQWTALWFPKQLKHNCSFFTLSNRAFGSVTTWQCTALLGPLQYTHIGFELILLSPHGSPDCPFLSPARKDPVTVDWLHDSPVLILIW